jgi:hypothetical protein
MHARVIVPENSHPAARSAAEILERKLAPGAGDIVLTVAPSTKLKHDGYEIAFAKGVATVKASRPRALLFAAGDYELWKDRKSGSFLRDPSFAIRTSQFEREFSIAENVAQLGVNILIGPTGRGGMGEKLEQECKDADVACYAFLYGNDFTRWSSGLYEQIIKTNPSAKGTPGKASFEKARLCPSDPATWTAIRDYVKRFLEQSHADGLYATFWDSYGINCQCDRCVKSGMNKFPNQIERCVKEYNDVVSAMGKKLIVRTWSSGVPHWLNDEFVHAPGYGGFGGEATDLWGRVIAGTSPDIMIQTKVYHADCQPDARFSTLLGKAKPHTEIAEYQIAGQTLGRFYFPASSVDYNAWTMRKAFELVGAEGGVNVFPGGTRQSNYTLSNDIVNSINLYAWRRLSWDIKADVEKIWMDWAVPIYGAKAAPHIVKALKLSEEAVNRTFSPLGMGSSTNSDFARTIARKETLLMYTNRHYLPEYAKFLEPTKENIRRVADEKAEALRKVGEMARELELAKPDLTREQAAELATRFDWFREFAICASHIDESLWRYRYLRYLASMLTTDPEQLKPIAKSYEAVQQHAKLLFQYDPAQKFSCYNTALGNLATKPALGSPVPLMKELYDESVKLVESIAGPDYAK